MNNGFKIIGGSSNPLLVEDVCKYILHEFNYTIKPTDVLLDKFPDGELKIQIQENLRGYHVFVIQSLCNPVNDNLMELCLILDSLKRCNTQEVTVVMPFYGYSRQDRKNTPRSPISAKVVADLIQTCNIDRIVTIDLHSPQIQGFFNCSMDNLYASKVLIEHIDKNKDLVIVSPDKGGLEKAVEYATKLNKPVAFCYKHRDESGQIDNMRLIGEVENKYCILIDDMIDSGSTLIKAANILKENNAKSIEVYATHGIFSGNSIDKLLDSCIERINITDTIKLPKKLLTSNKFNVISVDKMISEAIVKIYTKESISNLFL